MQHSVLTRQSGHTVHPDKVCLTVSCMHAHPVQGLESLRTLDYNIALLHELAEFASSTGAVSKKIFMENAMRDLSTTLCCGIARQVLASAPLRTRLDGRSVLPGRPIPTDGLA